MIHSVCGLLGLLAVWPLTLFAQSAAPMPGPQAGQKVVFLGDSVTQFADKPSGYIRLVEAAMGQLGRPITAIGAGVAGNNSRDMLARVDRDVIARKPDWMTFSCGLNDQGHVPPEEFKKNITAIIDKATAAGIKVVIFTATICKDPSGNGNQPPSPYNVILEGLARQRHFLLSDMRAEMEETLARERSEAHPVGFILTIDGVHMNGLGHEMMATRLLKTFGYSDAQIAQAREKWLDVPDAFQFKSGAGVSVRQYLQLRDLATKKGLSTDAFAASMTAKDIQATISGGH